VLVEQEQALLEQDKELLGATLFLARLLLLAVAVAVLGISLQV
jgi:hypothetical protein